LQPEDVLRRADALWRDTERPASVRFGAARRAVTTADPALSEVFAAAYSQTEQAGQAAMERELLAALGPLPDTTLYMLVGPQPGPDARFPWSVYLLESARRTAATAPAASGADAPEGDPLAPLMARLSAVPFADPSIIGVVRNQMNVGDASAELPELNLPVPSVQELLAGGVSFQPTCVAMVLPLGGPYGGIGSSIQAGAATAQSQMSQGGVSVDLRFIDTQNPMWVQELASLPPQCVTVGGPIQPDALTVARERGGLAGRAVFAFLGRLDDGQEGYNTWRFFPSRQDQILTMLRFAGQMGVHSFGIFHPDDNYGMGMAQEFSGLVGQAGGTVTSTASYPLSTPEEWAKIAGGFVNVRVVNKVPIPSSPFQGVFLPDSWSNMDMVISTLFYQGEDTQLLMGTSVWEQALLDSPPAVLNNMGLAVFPGMWDARSLEVPARLLAAGLGRKVDTWAALGYDFVRFAAAAHLEPGMTNADINARLSGAQNMSWAMAPIRWQGGRAAQELFVLAPTKSAPVRVDATAFKQRMDKTKARSERRAARALGKR